MRSAGFIGGSSDVRIPGRGLPAGVSTANPPNSTRTPLPGAVLVQSPLKGSGSVSGVVGSTYPGIPADRQQAGDLHAMQLVAGPYTSTTIDRLRFVLSYFAEATDRTIPLGPQLSVPTVTAAATAPYVRWRVQLGVQPEYDRTWTASWSQGGTGGAARSAILSATVGYLGSAPATVDLVIPDLTGAAGWDDNWGPRVGVEAQYTVAATDWTAAGGVLTGPVSDGGMIFGATRLGTITP